MYIIKTTLIIDPNNSNIISVIIVENTQIILHLVFFFIGITITLFLVYSGYILLFTM